jgi:hypothetical protein
MNVRYDYQLIEVLRDGSLLKHGSVPGASEAFEFLNRIRRYFGAQGRHNFYIRQMPGESTAHA